MRYVGLLVGTAIASHKTPDTAAAAAQDHQLCGHTHQETSPNRHVVNGQREDRANERRTILFSSNVNRRQLCGRFNGLRRNVRVKDLGVCAGG